MIMPINQITNSTRLILRRMETRDGDVVFRYRSLPDVSIFQGWTPLDGSEVEQYALQMAQRKSFEPGSWEQVVLQDLEGQVIGDVAACIDVDTSLQAELGIALDPKFQKMGLATEAVIAICDFLFSKKSIRRIHVSIDPRNTASLNLFSRVGFRQEAHHLESLYFKGEWCDDIVMAILAKEWQRQARK